MTDDCLLDDVPTHLHASQDLCINQLQQARSNLPDSMTDERPTDRLVMHYKMQMVNFMGVLFGRLLSFEVRGRNQTI